MAYGLLTRLIATCISLSYEDASILTKIPTESIGSSGVMEGVGSLWVSSTYSAELLKVNYDGSTIERYDTPGKGVVMFGQPGNSRITGAHGLEWVDSSNIWVAVPPSQRIYLLNPQTMQVRHSISTPGPRPHGIVLYKHALWCADTGMGRIHKLNPDDGNVLDEISVPDPEVHGMTLYDGEIWFCCASTRRVCKLTLPP